MDVLLDTSGLSDGAGLLVKGDTVGCRVSRLSATFGASAVCDELALLVSAVVVDVPDLRVEGNDSLPSSSDSLPDTEPLSTLKVRLTRSFCDNCLLTER